MSKLNRDELNATLQEIARVAPGAGPLLVALDALELANEILQKGIYGDPVISTEIFGKGLDTLIIVKEQKL